MNYIDSYIQSLHDEETVINTLLTTYLANKSLTIVLHGDCITGYDMKMRQSDIAALIEELKYFKSVADADGRIYFGRYIYLTYFCQTFSLRFVKKPVDDLMSEWAAKVFPTLIEPILKNAKHCECEGSMTFSEMLKILKDPTDHWTEDGEFFYTTYCLSAIKERTELVKTCIKNMATISKSIAMKKLDEILWAYFVLAENKTENY